MRYAPIALAAAGLGLFAATSPAVAQNAPAGRYQLADVGGKPLPFESEVEGDCREEITAATLTLDANGKWKLEKTERETCGTKTDQENESDDEQYRMDGNTIRFDDDDRADDTDADKDLDDLASATLEGSVLHVRLSGGAIAVFRRI